MIVAYNDSSSATNEFLVTYNHEDGTYSFKADNHKYISSVEHPEGYHLIQAKKETIDEFCRFTIITDKNGAISLATEGGAFWTRAGNAFTDSIEATN